MFGREGRCKVKEPDKKTVTCRVLQKSLFSVGAHILKSPLHMSTSDQEMIPEIGPMNIATISAGFEKGDFLVREEQGNRVYFDFFEEVR